MRNFIKVKRFFIILGFLIAFTFFIRISFNYYQVGKDNFTNDKSELKQKVVGSYNVNPIYIDDTDPTRNWATTEASYDWCTGSGTINDPYIIENVIVNGLNSDNCIMIKHSIIYFIIRKCTLYNSGFSNAGIYLNYVDNAWLDNNFCFSNYHGIFLKG
ncbi:MAG: hypothetical protein ACFFBK_08270, partial [Promethearchaeota archaeon]